MIRYKIDVVKALADRGFTPSRIRKNKFLGETTMQRLRNQSTINTKTLGTVCLMLRCQPSDILEVVATDEEKLKYF